MVGSRKFRADGKQDGQVRTGRQDKRSPHHQGLTDQPQQRQPPNQQHLPSCRMISRTQSWGGGLRLAGTTPFFDGHWEVTRTTDGQESPDLIAADGTTIYRRGSPLIDSNVHPRAPELKVTNLRATEAARFLRGVPVYRCRDMELPDTLVPEHLMGRTAIHVSLPNVNGTFGFQTSATVTPCEDRPGGAIRLATIQAKRDFKPPLAKRPRIVPSRPEPRDTEQWIATSYGTDTDDDFSTAAVMLEECAVVTNGSMIKPITACTSSSSTTTNTSQAMAAELAVLRSLKPGAGGSRNIVPVPGSQRPYLTNGACGLIQMSSPRSSSVSNVSTDEGSLGTSNGQGLDQSESEGLYPLRKG